MVIQGRLRFDLLDVQCSLCLVGLLASLGPSLTHCGKIFSEPLSFLLITTARCGTYRAHL